MEVSVLLLVTLLFIINCVCHFRGATKTVLCVCEYHKPMVADICIRYRGLRHLLGRWEGQGFSRDLKALYRLLDAGNAQRAELEVKHLL